MSRYQWPIHFALLHNDAFWVFDEIQLMGAGLSTSTQLEAFRRSMASGKTGRSIWISATLHPDWLDTVDFRPYLSKLGKHTLTDSDRFHTLVTRRTQAAKKLARAEIQLTPENSKGKYQAYIDSLSKEITDHHINTAQTLVILNSVERAQLLYQKIIRLAPENNLLLLHSHFRPLERRRIETALRENVPGRIIITTQAIEAGVDITSGVLFTEIAPWPSLVQRFGRCNRYGELESATVFWIDMADDNKLALPYSPTELESSRTRLQDLHFVGSRNLPAVEPIKASGLVLRRKDFLELFNTEPDLSGFDIDISPYIRDQGNPQLQVFWRDFTDQPGEQAPVLSDELCPVSLGRLDSKKQPPFIWDSLSGKWSPLHRSVPLRAGMTLMLRAGDGGYDPELGYFADMKAKVEIFCGPDTSTAEEVYSNDWRSRLPIPIPLGKHLENTAAESKLLCETLNETAYRKAIIQAAAWHDVGKSHEIFQTTLTGCWPENDPKKSSLWAKSECKGKHARPYFRHELASMLAWFLAERQKKDEENLTAFLIAAHHGKVRMGLRAMPEESEPSDVDNIRFARGIWEGDQLPEILLDNGDLIPATRLRLDIMELGEGNMGPSWSARTQKLLQEHGPFRLAWLETLVRIADWRASRREQEEI
jgi:CRISPR-associated endonuclease/helicase Cas3